MTPDLDIILAELETLDGPLECRAIAKRFEEALTIIGDADHPQKALLRAECIGFSFTEGTGDRKDRSTYFGPEFSMQDNQGNEREFPPLTAVNADVLAHWGRRADKTENPFLKARYSDLVWDLSMPAIQQKPNVSFARMAIDSTLLAVAKRAFTYSIQAVTRLKRAFALSRSIRDEARQRKVVAAMIAFEDDLTKSSHARPWGFCFETLLLTPKVSLEPDQHSKLLQDMEERLTRMSQEPFPDPPIMEPAVDLLLKYFRRAGAAADVRRVLETFAQAVERFAEKASPFPASSWLDKVHERLTDEGMNKEADRVALQMRKVEAQIPTQFKEYSSVVTIPRAELDAEVAGILDGPRDEVLVRFGAMFVIDPDKTGRELKEAAKEHPFQHMIALVIHDDEGRKVSSAGSVEDDFDGRVAYAMGQTLQTQAPFLRHFIVSLLAKHPVNSDTILAFLGSTSIFRADRHNTIKRGLDAYSVSDYHVALCVLLPELEAGLRRLLQTQGGSVYKRSRHGGTQLKNLDEILRDEAVKAVLTPSIARYFQILLTDDRGWNVRNQICHGLIPPEKVALPFADRVVHALILLGCVRLGPRPEEAT